MSSLLNNLHSNPPARLCPLSIDDKSDLRWWCYFLPHYSGVSLIKDTPWVHSAFFLSTDACASGAGGFYQGQYFHTPFPALRGQRFIINCDIKNSVLALHSGLSRTCGMQLCLREIWFLSLLSILN